MENKRIYYFRGKDFKKAYKLADEAFRLCVILNDFCKYHSEGEDINYLIPFAKMLCNKTDDLLYFFCNVDMNIIEDDTEK